MTKEREVVIGPKPIEYYFYFIMKELSYHHRITVKVRATTDSPDRFLVDDTFNDLFKKISTGETKADGATIELIKKLQESLVLMRKEDMREMVPIFFDRMEKTKHLIKMVTSFGVDLKESEEHVPLESRKKDKFIGSKYVLEIWPNLRDR